MLPVTNVTGRRYDMSGPCSMPNAGGREEYEAQWELVCDYHKDCFPDNAKMFNKDGEVIIHSFIFRREWLRKRGRLKTGKTV
jgi:hypothetical protein